MSVYRMTAMEEDVYTARDRPETLLSMVKLGVLIDRSVKHGKTRLSRVYIQT